MASQRQAYSLYLIGHSLMAASASAMTVAAVGGTCNMISPWRLAWSRILRYNRYERTTLLASSAILSESIFTDDASSFRYPKRSPP